MQRKWLQLRWDLALLALLAAGGGASASLGEKVQTKCFYLNSYHRGYPWSDGIEAALGAALKDVCTIETFEMDTKRHPDEPYAQKAGEAARAAIARSKPDVIIASDDPASKYVIAPHFKNVKTPVVFCGVNWSGSEYGYPFANVTGMIEVFPIRPIADAIKRVKPTARRGVYLAPDTLTDRRVAGLLPFFDELGLNVEPSFVKTAAEFEARFKEAQAKDFLLLTTINGIEGLTPEAARRIVEAHGRVFSSGWLGFSSDLVMYTMSVRPEEQGQYAGEVAAKILRGAKPSDFPIVPNRQWDEIVNKRLLDKAGLSLPKDLVERAKVID